MSRLLFFGPRYHKSGQVGGIVVSFEMLLGELDKMDVDYIAIDTNKRNYNNRLMAMVKILWYAARLIPKASHISLHGTAKDYVYIAPSVVCLSKLCGKSVSLRKFAGSFREVYADASSMSKFLIRYVLRNASVNFFQTRYLVDFFSDFNPNTFWLPTARPRSKMHRGTEPFGARFIFLGHVSREKGILELIEAADRLPDNYRVDIFGHLVEENLEANIAASKTTYKGWLAPHEVSEVLIGYDVLVLPTFWKGEGYPGVIIEAFSVGIPVVATALEGIKEIVVHGENGLLVEPKNVDQLVEAIQSFSKENYPKFTMNAKKSFEQFDSAVVTRKYFDVIKS